VTGRLLGSAALLALSRPRLWAIGLAGFLARGGIVFFLLPIVALPSVVGVTTFVGPNAVTGAGLSPRFVVLAAASASGIAAWLILGTIVGSLADLAFVREAARTDGEPAPTDDELVRTDGQPARPSLELEGSPGFDPQDAPDRVEGGHVRGGSIARLVCIRFAALLPLGLVAAWGVVRLVEIGYRELVLPGDLARPFFLRVLAAAPDVVVLLIVAWLAAELVGAVAVRLAIVEDRSIVRALGGALRSIVRRPLGSLGVLAGTIGGSLIVVGPGLVTASIAWDGVRRALLGDGSAPAALLAVGVFVATWTAGLVLAGVAAAWRSTAWSSVVLRDLRATGRGALGARAGRLGSDLPSV
jgi:hypothetical protein